jgi:hypothetical protein
LPLTINSTGRLIPYIFNGPTTWLESVTYGLTESQTHQNTRNQQLINIKLNCLIFRAIALESHNVTRQALGIYSGFDPAILTQIFDDSGEVRTGKGKSSTTQAGLEPA